MKITNVEPDQLAQALIKYYCDYHDAQECEDAKFERTVSFALLEVLYVFARDFDTPLDEIKASIRTGFQSDEDYVLKLGRERSQGWSASKSLADLPMASELIQ